MADDTERLIVLVEARMTQLEREMKKASRVTGTEFTRMERRGKQAADRIESTMGGMATRVGSIFKNFGAGLLAGVAAGGISGIVAGFGSVAKGIAEIGDQAKLAGLSMQAFQEWKAVAEANRIPVDAMADAFKELSIRADEFATNGGGGAAEAFQRLGLTPAEVKAKLADPSRFMLELIDRTQRLRNVAAGNRIFDELFGGQGGERYVALIEQGSTGIRATIDQAHRLGNVLSDDVITRAAEIDRQFKIATTTVSTALKGAIIDAVTALQDFIDRFNGFEARRDASLDEDLAALGRERLEIETKIAEIRSRGDGMAGDGILGTSIGDSGALGAIADHERRMEAIAAEEKMITDVLEARRKLRETPAPTSVSIPAGPIVPVTPPSPRSASRSNAVSEIERERQAVSQLIAELERELSLIGASDLEREISNQLRRAGAAATDQEKANIAALITAIQAEEAAQRKATDAKAEFAQLAQGALSGFAQDLLSGATAGQAFGNMINRLAAQLVDLAIQLAIIKPLMKIFGFAGGGFVSADPWAGMRLAGGGHVRGPGTSTSDSIPAMLSDGEYVVRAAAVRAIGVRTLDAINTGQVPAYASGGIHGDAPSFANDNRPRSANDNAPPAVTINAPITVDGSAGTPEQNDDLARKMAKEFEGMARVVIADEMRKAGRPGNIANSRGYGR